jgi:hypothetical protein
MSGWGQMERGGFEALSVSKCKTPVTGNTSNCHVYFNACRHFAYLRYLQGWGWIYIGYVSSAKLTHHETLKNPN